MYKIVADSSCDMLTLEGVNFEAVPLTISTDEREYIDDKSLDCHEMLDYLASFKGRSYTACPSTESWMKAFEGGDELYILTLTSGLSGTYNSACIAADLYLEEHPDAKIFCIDSLSTGPEIRLLIEKIVELKEAGKDFEEVKEAVKEYQKHTRLFFSFSSLHNFAQNGRINKILAKSIGMLGIRILGTANQEGKIESIGKIRGDKKVLIALLKEMANAGFTNGKVYIAHVENEALAERVKKVVLDNFPEANVLIYPTRGICSYYAERGGIVVGCEC